MMCEIIQSNLNNSPAHAHTHLRFTLVYRLNDRRVCACVFVGGMEGSTPHALHGCCDWVVLDTTAVTWLIDWLVVCMVDWLIGGISIDFVFNLCLIKQAIFNWIRALKRNGTLNAKLGLKIILSVMTMLGNSIATTRTRALQFCNRIQIVIQLILFVNYLRNITIIRHHQITC